MSEMMQVPDGWEVKPFSSLASINMGQSPESEFVNENQEGMAFLQGNAEFGDVNPQELYWVTVPKKTAKKDDILISVRAPVGDMNIADKEYCIGRGLSALTIKKIDHKFGFYALFQERVQLDRLAQGSTFLAIGKNDFDKLLIKYPKEKKEQEKIAKILSTLDKAIESTNRLIEKEKNIKTALMQELLTNGIDQNGQIRTKATHIYKESELGLIPDEWEVVSLEKHTDITKLAGFEFTEYFNYEEEGEIIALRALNVSNGQIILSDIKTIPLDTSNKLPRSKLYIGDILFTYVGTLGEVALIEENNKYHLAPNVAKISVKDTNELLPKFILIYLMSYSGQQQIKNLSTTTSQPAINMENIRQIKIIITKKKKKKKIAKILTKKNKKIQTEETNLAKLKELKKGLMNDLLSGKVRVKCL